MADFECLPDDGPFGYCSVGSERKRGGGVREVRMMLLETFFFVPSLFSLR
jgi:hypothetical protein